MENDELKDFKKTLLKKGYSSETAEQIVKWYS